MGQEGMKETGSIISFCRFRGRCSRKVFEPDSAFAHTASLPPRFLRGNSPVSWIGMRYARGGLGCYRQPLDRHAEVVHQQHLGERQLSQQAAETPVGVSQRKFAE